MYMWFLYPDGDREPMSGRYEDGLHPFCTDLEDAITDYRENTSEYRHHL
jgi:hypothetical protein